ncbi:MAG: agmatinase [Dehalococcoidia bacterium]|nr:agmatinase [Dehalococcoidia bacterium]
MRQEDFYPPYGFLALTPERSAYEASRAVVLPVPYDSTVTARAGARDGPHAIISASQDLEPYDLALGYDTSAHGIHTLPDVAPHSGSPEAMVDRVERVVGSLLDDGKFVLTLGGEHTITVGAVRAHARRFPDLSVLSFDAHADLREEYLDSPYNHACVMRRVLDVCPAVQVGMRSASADQARLIEERKLPFLTTKAYRALVGAPAAISALLTENVYVSVDLDGLDPSQMAAVGTPEPGGLLWDEVIDLLTAVARERRIVGCDVVELAPDLGPFACGVLAAKLAYRLIGLALGPPHQ